MRKVLLAVAAVAALGLLGAGRANAQSIQIYYGPNYLAQPPVYAPYGVGYAPYGVGYAPPVYYYPNYYSVRGPAQPFDYANSFSARFWSGNLNSYSPGYYPSNSFYGGGYSGRRWR